MCEAGDADVLGFEELIDAEARAFTADAGGFQSAERRALVRRVAGIDADDTEFQRFGDAPDARVVAREEVGGQAELLYGDRKSVV